MALLWIFVACLPVALGDQDGTEGIHVVSKESFLVDRYDKNFMPATTNFESIINTTQGQIKEFLKGYSRDSLMAKLNNVSLLMNYSMDSLLAEQDNASWKDWAVGELHNVNSTLHNISWKNYSDQCTAILKNASKHQICNLPEATQMPFYMQASQSIVSVLLNHFAFTRADLTKSATLFNHGMSTAVLASFASRVYQDYTKGGALTFLWDLVLSFGKLSLAIGELLLAIGELLLSILLSILEIIAAIILPFLEIIAAIFAFIFDLIKPVLSAVVYAFFTGMIVGAMTMNPAAGLAAAALIFGCNLVYEALFGSNVDSGPINGLDFSGVHFYGFGDFSGVHFGDFNGFRGFANLGGFSEITCKCVQWSRAFDQLPTVLSVLVLMNTENLHESRQPVLACMGFLTVIYAPFMILVGPLLVITGSVIFFYIPIIFALVVFGVPMVVSQCLPQKSEDQREDALLGDDEDKVKEKEKERRENEAARAEMIMKVLLVPLIVYVQFVGEATARYFDHEGWIASVYNTWAARTWKQYFCHLFTADAVTRALVFVGLM